MRSSAGSRPSPGALLVAALLLALSAPAAAETDGAVAVPPAGAAEPADEGAGAGFGLDALLDGMASTRGVSAAFRERRDVALLVEPLESRGALYFVPPDRMARFTVEPAEAALLVEGDTLRLREGGEDTELDLSSSPVARAFVENFMAVFAGDRARLEERYRAELRGDAAAWELALAPRSPALARFLEVVLLRGDAAGMREMEIRDVDGDRTVTVLERVDHDRSFSAAELARIFGEGRPLSEAP